MRAKTYTSKVQGTSKVQIRYKVKKQQGMYRRGGTGGADVIEFEKSFVGQVADTGAWVRGLRGW